MRQPWRPAAVAQTVRQAAGGPAQRRNLRCIYSDLGTLAKMIMLAADSTQKIEGKKTSPNIPKV